MSEYIGPRKDRFWTDDNTKKLKLYFDKNWSVRQIADRLGCSRNMIIGKIYRMRGKEGGHKMFPVRAPQPSGGRPKGSKNGPHVARRPVRYNPTLATIAKLTGPVPIALFKSTGSNGGKKTVGDLIMQLTNDSCRWPEGDPFKNDFSYCGHRVKEGSPYCEHHFEVAREPRKIKK
jgi:GcrA cell cycle regulator